MTARGTILSVNVGRARCFDFHGRPATSAIWKRPVRDRVGVRGVNLDGDEQADRGAHGGPDKAVYAYASEDIRWWERQLGRSLEPGIFGENLTIAGIDVNGAVVGESWQVGTAVLEASEPRLPCWRLGVRMGDENFPRRFVAANRPGSYLRIVREGELGVGDEVRVVERPAHGVSIGDVFRIYTRHRHEAERLLSVPGLSGAWRDWAERQLADAASTPAS